MLNYRVVFIFQSGFQADQSHKLKSSSQILIALNCIPSTKITIVLISTVTKVQNLIYENHCRVSSQNIFNNLKVYESHQSIKQDVVAQNFHDVHVTERLRANITKC